VAETGFHLDDVSGGEVPLFLQPAALCCQVHGTEIARVEKEGLYPSCDGLFTFTPGLTLMIRVADCTALALWAGRKAAMVLHAGWRGAAKGILQKGLAVFQEEGIGPEEISARFFPSARSCCYEIKEDVFMHIPEAMQLFIEERSGKYYLNIPSFLENTLKESGCRSVTTDSRCSICSPGFFSFRRDKTDKRNGAWIRL